MAHTLMLVQKIEYSLSVKPTGARWSNALGIDIDSTQQGVR
jgi:hypothetical protein